MGDYSPDLIFSSRHTCKIDGLVLIGSGTARDYTLKQAQRQSPLFLICPYANFAIGKSPTCVPERATSPETRTTLTPALSSTTETTHSSNPDARYTPSLSGATTLLGKDEHQQPQPNEESPSSRSPNDGTPYGESFLVRFLLTVKGVLRFRIVNALLVFVPMGITLRKSRIEYHSCFSIAV